jgi:hypothetical protein
LDFNPRPDLSGHLGTGEGRDRYPGPLFFITKLLINFEKLWQKEKQKQPFVVSA